MKLLKLLVIIFPLFLNVFPNYYAFLKTPAKMSYSGQASWFDPWDINVYAAAIRWGQNHWLFLENNYTTLPHQPILFYPLYALTGWLFKSFSPFFLFHLLAIIIGGLCLLVLIKLIKIFIKSEIKSLIALWLISLAGGLGFLFFPKFLSADLSITGFTFVSYFQRPHEALAITGYLLALVYFYLAIERKKKSLYFLSLLFLIISLIFYPYYLLSYLVILSFYSLFIYLKNEKTEENAFIYLFINISSSSLFLLGYLLYLSSSPGFTGILSQELKTPGLLQIVSGYGLMIPFLIYQLFLKKKTNGQLFLNSWFFISLLLSYLPFGFARFYLRGLFFPLVLLALMAIDNFSGQSKILEKIILIFLIILTPLSTFYITYKRMAEIKNNNPWFYLSQEERQALNFLKDKTKPGSGVLTSYTLGNYLPANTNNRVYFGHFLQTPNAREKINNLTQFYSNRFSEQKARKFLEEEKISYVVWGKEEKNLTKLYSKKKRLDYQFLKIVFQNKEVTIFNLITIKG